jgi:hypothetical protein
MQYRIGLLKTLKRKAPLLIRGTIQVLKDGGAMFDQLLGKIWQGSGADGQDFLCLFGSEAESLTAITGCQGAGGIAQKQVAEAFIDHSGGQETAVFFVTGVPPSQAQVPFVQVLAWF